MYINCPHCNKNITLSARENQTVAGCHFCNGYFKVEILNPASNKSSIVPDANEIKVLCPQCSRKILMPKSMLDTEINCPDCHAEYEVNAKNVIFSIPDSRVATGAQLKEPVKLKAPKSIKIPKGKPNKSRTVTIRPQAK